MFTTTENKQGAFPLLVRITYKQGLIEKSKENIFHLESHTACMQGSQRTTLIGILSLQMNSVFPTGLTVARTFPGIGNNANTLSSFLLGLHTSSIRRCHPPAGKALIGLSRLT